MGEALELIKDVNDANWGNHIIQVLFYISLVVILVLEKNRWKKVTYGWYSALVLIALNIPVTVFITNKVFGPSIAYYCRLYSNIPILIVIAMAVVLLINRINKKIKPVVFAIVVALIVITGNCFYSQDFWSKADNLNKVPGDMKYICDTLEIIKDEEELTILVPNSLSSYVRQYDAAIHLLTGRESVDSLALELDKDVPDVEYIMKNSGLRGAEYVVVKNTNSVRSAFESKGYSARVNTDGYLAYKVSGYDYIRNEYNDREEIISATFYDKDGNKTVNTSYGYCTVKYTYDSREQIIEERFYDTEGNPKAIWYGMYGERYVRNDDNQIVKITYLDADGNPGVRYGGFTSIVYEYSEATLTTYAQILVERYYDVNDNLVSCTSGYSGIRYQYDSKNMRTGCTFIDDEGNTVTSIGGNSGELYTYDANNRLVQYTYVDSAGNKVNTTSGYAILKIVYNAAGTVTGYEYYDKDGNLIK